MSDARHPLYSLTFLVKRQFVTPLDVDETIESFDPHALLATFRYKAKSRSFLRVVVKEVIVFKINGDEIMREPYDLIDHEGDCDLSIMERLVRYPIPKDVSIEDQLTSHGFVYAAGIPRNIDVVHRHSLSMPGMPAFHSFWRRGFSLKELYRNNVMFSY